jgi:hypothetical protein
MAKISSGPRKGREFLDKLRDCCLLKIPPPVPFVELVMEIVSEVYQSCAAC